MNTQTVRFLLGLTCAIALALALVPRIHQRIKWHGHRSQIVEWSRNLKRLPQKSEMYTIQADNGQWLSVSTAELKVVSDYSSATYDGATPDPSRYFVAPPGKWVNSIDEVLATWDDYY